MCTAIANPVSSTGQRDMAFLIRESAEEYHARSKEFLTGHQLADFRRCPALYRKRKLGPVGDEDRPAHLIDRALRTLVLKGRDQFEAEYAVGGPINPQTGEMFGPTTREFAEWAEVQGKAALTLEQFDLVESMADGVRANGLAMDLLSEGIAEGVVRTEYCGVPSQIRIDWFDPHRGIVDLETCDDLTRFEADAKHHGYVHHVAFRRAVLAQVIAVLMPMFLISVERELPYRCGVWKVHDDALAQARRDNEAAIERLKRCGATDTWSTGYEECRVLDAI